MSMFIIGLGVLAFAYLWNRIEELEKDLRELIEEERNARIEYNQTIESILWPHIANPYIHNKED